MIETVIELAKMVACVSGAVIMTAIAVILCSVAYVCIKPDRNG